MGLARHRVATETMREERRGWGVAGELLYRGAGRERRQARVTGATARRRRQSCLPSCLPA